MPEFYGDEAQLRAGEAVLLRDPLRRGDDHVARKSHRLAAASLCGCHRPPLTAGVRYRTLRQMMSRHYQDQELPGLLSAGDTAVMRRARLISAACMLLLVMGCGSTVPLRGTSSAGYGGDGLGVSGTGAGSSSNLGGANSSAGAGPAGSGGVGSSGSSVGGTSGGGATGSGSSALTAGGSAGGTPNGPAVASNAPVEVGFWVANAQSDKFLQAAGVGSLSVGNGDLVAKALVDSINAGGGIAGHKVVPVVAYLSPTSESFDRQAQSACSVFFEDHHVSAVISASRFDEPLLECSRQRGVPFLYPLGFEPFGKNYHAKYWNFVDTNGIDLDRMQKPYVDALFAQKYFQPWDSARGSAGSAATTPVKIGVIYQDLPEQGDVLDRSLVPALRAHGLAVAASFQGHSARSTADTSNQASAMQNAVLKFRSEGVTHVLFLGDNGGQLLFFTQAADSQAYYPRLGLSGLQQAGASLQSVAPKNSLRGALGSGWMPVWDMDAANDPGASSAQQRCRKILTQRGIDLSSRTAFAMSAAICEGVFTLQTAWTSSGDVTSRGFFAGLDRTGSRYTPVITFRSDLSDPLRTGARLYRPFAYDTSCACFQYTGPAQPLT